MKISQQGLALTIKAEVGQGRPHLRTSMDELGRTMIGYGHTLLYREFLTMPMSIQGSYDLMLKDFIKLEELPGIKSLKIEQHQFDAILCWAYHVSQGRAMAKGEEFEQSALLEYANSGKMQLCAAEFDKWVLVGNKLNRKHVSRRENEKYLFYYAKLPIGALI